MSISSVRNKTVYPLSFFLISSHRFFFSFLWVMIIQLYIHTSYKYSVFYGKLFRFFSRVEKALKASMYYERLLKTHFFFFEPIFLCIPLNVKGLGIYVWMNKTKLIFFACFLTKKWLIVFIGDYIVTLQWERKH